MGKTKKQTYYIEIERQGSPMWVVKVEATSKEEAEAKALRAIHETDDIYDVSREAVQDMLDEGSIDYIIDEDGYEIDIDGNDYEED